LAYFIKYFINFKTKMMTKMIISQLLVFALILLCGVNSIKAFDRGFIKPYPPTAEEAIAMVKTFPCMSEVITPFKQELDWKAEWVEDRWYVIGLFESPWGVKFIREATIGYRQIYVWGCFRYLRGYIKGERTLIGYAPYSAYLMLPPRKWVISKAQEWGLKTLYTRLTPEIAIKLIKEDPKFINALKNRQVLDTVAELIVDNVESQKWWFAFYVIQEESSKALLVVEAIEGINRWNKKYGFKQIYLHWEIPYYMADWVRKVAKERSWLEAN
jgi:hypothetical protein